ncbi:MAG: hypothetical protein EOL87_01950 [Spartobacteria bacterium]|nr:hypothetical protein [Spartobacteria bacterium]
MKVDQFIIPADLDDARLQLEQLGDKALPAAGCTAFHFYSDNVTKTAVSLSALGLAGVEEDGDEFRIGAMTPIADFMKISSSGWVLNRVAHNFASHQIRNISTLGGNMCKAFPWNDFPVALRVLEGSVDFFSGTGQTIALDEFFEDNVSRSLGAGDLLLSVNIRKKPEASGFGYMKERMRSASFSLVTAAAAVTVQQGVIVSAKVAVGASVPRQQRLSELESALIGLTAEEAPVRSAVDEQTRSLRFLTKEGMSADYIATLSRVKLGDALMQAIEESKAGAK